MLTTFIHGKGLRPSKEYCHVDWVVADGLVNNQNDQGILLVLIGAYKGSFFIDALICVLPLLSICFYLHDSQVKSMYAILIVWMNMGLFSAESNSR